MSRKLLYGTITLFALLLVGAFLLLRQPNLGRLVYVQAGDIFIKALPDGRALKLTNDSLNSTPRFSTSGKWIAFRKGADQVWVIGADGKSAHSLPSDKLSKFDWSPHSDILAFTVKGELRIAISGQDDDLLIVPGPGQEHTGVHEFLWSPDGKWIAYDFDERPEVPGGEWPWRHSIRKVNVESRQSEMIVVYHPPNEEGFPGNTELAAWVGSRIYLWQCEVMSVSIMSDGCPLFFLDSDKKQNGTGTGSLLYPDFLSFAPTTRKMAISEGANRFTWTNKRIVVLDSENGKAETLTEPEVSAIFPAWSPDGSLIAYVAGPDIGAEVRGENEIHEGLARRRVWIMKPDGSEKRRLTSDENYREERPLWLEDGQHILFARSDANDQVSLWLMRLGGETPSKVADALSSHLPRYDLTENYEYLEYYGHRDWEIAYDFERRSR